MPEHRNNPAIAKPAYQAGLEAFLSKLPWGDLEEAAVPYREGDRGKAAAFLRTLRAETHLGLQLIGGDLAHGKRILEVGSGIGLLAGYLHSCGYDVTALEPGLGGFGISPALARAASLHPAFNSLRRLEISAEKLTTTDHGEFALIYSINVLEHIPSLEASVRSLASVLSADGLMIHTCPNYTIPYEPHFAIPLVPFLPQATETLVPRLKKSELWQSLNFITARRLLLICDRCGLVARLEPGVMLATFMRLDSDPEFRQRQGSAFVGRVFQALKRTRLLNMLKLLPRNWSTPMRVRITHAATKAKCRTA